MFVTIEGIEGSGKTTQVRLLAEALGRLGVRVRVTHEPGGTPLGERIRELLLHRRDLEISPLAELFLILADRAEHLERVVRPALARGEVVLSDRFSESTLAYQAYGRGLDLDLVRTADAAVRQGLSPDLTFVLDCPVAVGLARTQLRRAGSRPDRFESEAASFHERVRTGFLALAAADPARIRVVDGTQPPERCAAEIFAAVRRLLQERA